MVFTDLLIPGGQRAESVVGDAAFLDALVRVEACWVLAQADAGLLAPEQAERIAGRMGRGADYDVEALASGAEGGGNPVIGLVQAIRARVAETASDSTIVVHRGLTSQDVMDTALVLLVSQGLRSVHDSLLSAGDALAEIVREYAGTPMAARTLGQHALPTTFGARAGRWLDGIAAAALATERSRTRLPISSGGAAGTNTALLSRENLADPSAGGPSEALLDRLNQAWAERLGLDVLETDQVWHTRRRPLIAALDPLVQAGAACGKIANDVVVSSRAEIGELAEPAAPGRGGSSAMPHKRNPSMSVLIRRSAVTATRSMGAVLESEALATEERSELAWHLEWEALRGIVRHGVIATSLTAELLDGLEISPENMARSLELDGPDAPGRAPEGWNTGNSAAQAHAAAERWHALRARSLDRYATDSIPSGTLEEH